MKKRLLSAFLALAMVLTLLPVTAFAVDYGTPSPMLPDAPGATYPVTVGGTVENRPFYVRNTTTGAVTSTVTVTRATQTYPDGREYGKWYWLDNRSSTTIHTYYEVTSGIVTGTNGSGQWYAGVGDYTNTTTVNVDGVATPVNRVRGAFTVLGTTPANLSGYQDSSLTIDIEGSTGITNVPGTLTNLTVTSKYMNGRGNVTALSTDRGDFTSAVKSGLTVNADNVSIANVNLAGRANTLTLKNCSVAGITMTGATFNSLAAEDAGAVSVYTAQRVTASENSQITGTIQLTGDGSTVSLTDTYGGAAINITSNGGSITVAGASVVGDILSKVRTTTGQWPSVTVSGGSAAGIAQLLGTGVTSNSNSITIQVNSTTGTTRIGADGIVAMNGNVTLNAADVNGPVTVPKGSLTVGGNGVNVTGVVALGGSDKTNLSMGATKSTFGGITGNGNLTIQSWTGARWIDGGNRYGVLNLGNYAGKGVAGGSFAKENATGDQFTDATVLEWFNSDLQYNVLVSGTQRDLYKKNELAQAISDIGTSNAKIGGYIKILGQTVLNRIVLKNGDVEWARIDYNDTTGIILPDRINNVNITTWLAPNNASIPSGVNQNIPISAAVAGELILNASATSTDVKRITKATAAANPPVVQNQNVRVSLSGNTISVSGAVRPGAGGVATVYIDLETDVVDTSGQPVVLRNVAVDFNDNGRVVSFNTIQPTTVTDAGVIVQDGVLVLNRGTGEKYNVTASVAVSASTLGLYTPNTGNEIKVTVGLGSWTKIRQQQLIDDIETDGKFIIGNNQAMLEAINAAQATITSNQSVDSWITNAKNTIWRNGIKDASGKDYITVGGSKLVPHSGNFDVNSANGVSSVIANYFNKAYIVPYLVMNITAFDPSAGTMTATLTPYFRVDVSSDTNGYQGAASSYTVQAGRALSALTGDMSTPVQVSLTLDPVNGSSNFNGKYMHQDSKYVYQGAGSTWSICHAGTNGSLGTIKVDDIVGPISMTTTIEKSSGVLRDLPACTYDDLQAAIDDTVPGRTAVNSEDIGTSAAETMDCINIGGKYTGSCDITMTGIARKVMVRAQGQHNVKSNAQNVDVQNQGGFTYIIQLKKDTVTASGDNVLVNGTAGGTVTVSTKKASAGQTVTVTVTPNAGYNVTGVTVRTDSGSNVSVSGSGTSYTFVMPSGAKTVTVTPTFNQSQTAASALVTVGTPSSGSGQAVTSAGANRVTPGTYVTVTTSPSAGQRTMGVNISTNGAATTAVRTGVNSFGFTVPANSTNVVVTPVFDANNGTNFSDVWSNAYYSSAVAWAVSKNVTSGTSTYEFSPTASCTRAQMVTFLWRAAGSPAVPTGTRNPFWDVKAGEYYYNAVLWAVSKGITNGVSASEFGINQTVTRAQAVTFLYRYSDSPSVSGSSGFSDVPSNEYYSRAVAWAAKTGVTNGTTPTTFSPNQACQRCQIVTFLYNDMA